MSAPAWQAWHCGDCNEELEEGSNGEWVCRSDGSRYDSHGRPIEDDEDEG